MLLQPLALAASIFTTGLISGFFYAYACSVTLGHAHLNATQYILVMQHINAEVRNPIFFFSFFGAAITLIVAVLLHLNQLNSLRFWLIVAAAVFYLAGGFALTALVNVPMNEALATVDATAANAQTIRQGYEGPWNLWNNIRTVFSSLAFLTLIAAAMVPPKA